MDFKKIKLENERNQHVTKRLNRLRAWGMFKVLYRDDIWRVFGFSLLMLLCALPIVLIITMGMTTNTAMEAKLPILSGLGFGTGAWSGAQQYADSLVQANNYRTAFFVFLGSLLFTVMFSGGFAVIRDAFWTGRLQTVGVLKSMGKGFFANIVYAFFANVIMSGTVYGGYVLLTLMLSALPKAVAIILFILYCILGLFIWTYCLIVCSVSVTYKQSVKQTLTDSWLLLWLNVLPNIIHVIIMLIPVGLFFLFQGTLLQTIFLILVFMFGGMYFPLVWQTHMMQTFALFYPMEVKKKKQSGAQNQSAVVE